MKRQDIALIRQQLEKTLAQYARLRTQRRPKSGWVSAIREALGMTKKQLAHRMGVSAPRISRLEQDEPTGSVTIKTMQKVAEELDCEFVYALVPKRTLQATVRNQARLVASRYMGRVSHTMYLESQQLTGDDADLLLDTTADDLVRDMPRYFWDVDDG